MSIQVICGWNGSEDVSLFDALMAAQEKYGDSRIAVVSIDAMKEEHELECITGFHYTGKNIPRAAIARFLEKNGSFLIRCKRGKVTGELYDNRGRVSAIDPQDAGGLWETIMSRACH